MKIYAGLDGGSTYLKAALIDEHKRVLRTGVTMQAWTAARPI